MDLNTPLQYVKGIGPARAEMLAARNLFTVTDLIYHLPFRYEDRRNVKPIAEVAIGEKAVVVARIDAARLTTFKKRGVGLLEATLRDGSGGTLLARWFHGERYADTLTSGTSLALFGKIEWDPAKHSKLVNQPEIEILAGHENLEQHLHLGRIVSVYEAVSRISTRVFRQLLQRILNEIKLPPDPLPAEIRDKLNLPELSQALRDAHMPEESADVMSLNEFRSAAQIRLIFDEFFWLECGLALKKFKGRAAPGIPFQLNESIREQVKKMLPFKPTQAQRRVTQEIVNDMKRSRPMNRLLQGDVGSGKTIVAAQAAVVAMGNGYQVAMLAPTEILATQHYVAFKRYIEDRLGHMLVLLVGSGPARQKREAKKLLQSGWARMVVGTHAILQEDVGFEKLGLVIVDEQHRFGVRQRLQLIKKGAQPDVLVMTATPIPRTLALTLYGDLDVSTIDESPQGRKPIATRQVKQTAVETVYKVLRNEIEKGRQAYIVYPVVEESETGAIKAAKEMYELLAGGVFQGVTIGLLHGKMPADEKDLVMKRFIANDVKILISTTVIEVGVDVPNATVMVIEHAERFGLAQLHQLRGRVGRSAHQSYCILVTGSLNEISRERIRTLLDSTDGFYIAEMDMKLRGPGEFFGTRQSGIPGLRVANLVRDIEILELARAEAELIVTTSGDNEVLRAMIQHLQQNWQRQYGLVQVG